MIKSPFFSCNRCVPSLSDSFVSCAFDRLFLVAFLSQYPVSHSAVPFCLIVLRRADFGSGLPCSDFRARSVSRVRNAARPACKPVGETNQRRMDDRDALRDGLITRHDCFFS